MPDNSPMTSAESNSTPALPHPSPAPRAVMLRILFGPEGLRAGWRLLVFVTIYLLASGVLTRILGASFHLRRGAALSVISWQFVWLKEGGGFACAFFAAWLMSRVEDRRLGVYGLPWSRAFRRNFCLGCVWGAVSVSTLVLSIWAVHGFSFGEIAQQTSTAATLGVLWFLAFLAVGFYEEFLTRGYAQFTLASGIGFWPAAILISALFGAAHLANPGEVWTGAVSAGLIGLWLALTLRRTGNLWFAVGFHAMFDYGETYVYSVPNSGMAFSGHLLNASLHGPRWITGGTVGPEGSIFAFILIALLFVIFDRVYRQTRYPQPHAIFAKRAENLAAGNRIARLDYDGSNSKTG